MVGDDDDDDDDDDIDDETMTRWSLFCVSLIRESYLIFEEKGKRGRRTTFRGRSETTFQSTLVVLCVNYIQYIPL